MAKLSSILAWETPWAEEPGGLQTERLNYHLQLRVIVVTRQEMTVPLTGMPAADVETCL